MILTNAYVNVLFAGRNLFPATGYLYMVWKMLAHCYNLMAPDTTAVFENVKFMRATTITQNNEITFEISIRVSDGCFEVGKIYTVHNTCALKVTLILFFFFSGKARSHCSSYWLHTCYS